MRMKKKKHGPERRALLSALTTENIAELYENKEKIYGNNNPLRIEIGCGKGDFVCGSVAMRMCIGDTTMGGECDFKGKKLCVSVDKFHVSVRNPEHKYEMVLIDDKGIVAKREVLCDEPAYFAFKVDDAAKFYRVEIFDATQDLRIAIGNPIWNKK